MMMVQADGVRSILLPCDNSISSQAAKKRKMHKKEKKEKIMSSSDSLVVHEDNSTFSSMGTSSDNHTDDKSRSKKKHKEHDGEPSSPSKGFPTTIDEDGITVHTHKSDITERSKKKKSSSSKPSSSKEKSSSSSISGTKKKEKSSASVASTASVENEEKSVSSVSSHATSMTGKSKEKKTSKKTNDSHHTEDGESKSGKKSNSSKSRGRSERSKVLLKTESERTFKLSRRLSDTSLISTRSAKSTRTTRSKSAMDKKKKSSKKSGGEDLSRRTRRSSAGSADSFDSSSLRGCPESDCMVIPDLNEEAEKNTEYTSGEISEIEEVKRSRTPSCKRSGGRERMTVSQTPNSNRRAIRKARKRFENDLDVPDLNKNSEASPEETATVLPEAESNVDLLNQMQQKFAQSPFRKCYGADTLSLTSPPQENGNDRGASSSSSSSSSLQNKNPFLNGAAQEPYVAPTHVVEQAPVLEKMELSLSERLQAGEQLSVEEALMVTVDKLRERNKKMQDRQAVLMKRIGELQELVETKESKVKALQYYLKKQKEGDHEALPGGTIRGITLLRNEEGFDPTDTDDLSWHEEESNRRIAGTSFQRTGHNIRRANSERRMPGLGGWYD